MSKKLLPKSTFGKNVLTLMTGTVLAQVIPIALSPVLSRLFTKDEFGTFALYASLLGFLGIVVGGRYELAIMLPKKDEDARNLLGLTLFITLGVALLTLLSVVFFRNDVATWFQSPNLATWLWLLPVGVLFAGAYQAFNYWSNRKSQYKRLATSRVVRAVGSSGAMVGFGMAGLKKGGLILGDTIGQGLATLTLWWQVWKEDSRLIKGWNRSGIKAMAKRYNQFPRFNLVGGVAEKSAAQLPFWMFAPVFGEAMVGALGMTYRIIGTPNAIIARAFGDVFRQRAAETYVDKGECRQLFLTTLKQLLLIATVPFIILFFVAPVAFEWVLGEGWGEAGVYAKLLAPMFFLQFITNPLANMFLVAEKQKYELFLQLYLVAVIGASLYVGCYVYGDERLAVLLVSILHSSKYLIELVLSYRYSLGKR